MGLKELKSNLDLVQGEGPVSGMADISVPNFQLDTDAASQKHIDSLQQVPGGDSNSPFQDLDGAQGPRFDLGPSSTLQQDSLATQVPGGDSSSPYQDYDGEVPPLFQKSTDLASQAHVSSLSAVPAQEGGFADRLDGATPTQYLDNMPN